MNTRLRNTMFLIVLYIPIISSLLFDFRFFERNLFYINITVFTILYGLSYLFKRIIPTKYSFYIPGVLVLIMSLIGLIYISSTGFDHFLDYVGLGIVLYLFLMAIVVLAAYKANLHLLSMNNYYEIKQNIINVLLPTLLLYSIGVILSNYSFHINCYSVVEFYILLICLGICIAIFLINYILIKILGFKQELYMYIILFLFTISYFALQTDIHVYPYGLEMILWSNVVYPMYLLGYVIFEIVRSLKQISNPKKAI